MFGNLLNSQPNTQLILMNTEIGTGLSYSGINSTLEIQGSSFMASTRNVNALVPSLFRTFCVDIR